MQMPSFRLPARFAYLGMLFTEILKVTCNVFLCYMLIVGIFLLPPVLLFVQNASNMIQAPLIDRATQVRHTTEVMNILLTGKVYSNDLTDAEVSHLFDVRQLLFVFVAATIGVVVLSFYLWMNRYRFAFFRRSKVLLVSIAAIIMWSFISALFFPVFFTIFHVLLFPNGNFSFPNTSILVETFPLTFFFLSYLFVQAGVVLVLAIQALLAYRQEVQ